MQPSTFNTLLIAAWAPTGSSPSQLAAATDVPLRVVIKNVGAVLCLLAFTVNELTSGSGPTSGIYRILPGETDILVIAPQQRLYGLANGGTGILAIAQSEAFPTG
jgi:hypothetical protein